MKEVDKLLKAEFIQKVYYPSWVSNMVLVKKANGKWRMCIDFKKLNKACPKDTYPLPRTNQLVEQPRAMISSLLWMPSLAIIKFGWYQKMRRKLLLLLTVVFIVIGSYPLGSKMQVQPINA